MKIQLLIIMCLLFTSFAEVCYPKGHYCFTNEECCSLKCYISSKKSISYPKGVKPGFCY